MNDPLLTPRERDGMTSAARALNSKLQQLVGARYTPLPGQAGLAVLDRQGKRIGTLFWEPVSLLQVAAGADGEQHQDDDNHHQRDQRPEQELAVAHVASVAQGQGQGAGAEGAPLGQGRRPGDDECYPDEEDHHRQHHRPGQQVVHAGRGTQSAGQGVGA